MTTTIYGVCASPFVRKTLIVAETLGIDFENVAVNPFDKPEGFEKISPLGKIPALKDGELTLAESSVICDYLSNKHGENALYPTDPAKRAQALWFEVYAGSKIVEVTGPVFYELVIKTKMLKEPSDMARVEEVKTTLAPVVFDYLESQVPADGFILGDMTIADIAIGTHFVNASYAQFTVDADKWPKLAAYIGRLLALPAFQKRMAADQAIFA